MNLKLNLKVLGEIIQDTTTLEVRIDRLPPGTYAEEQIAKLKAEAKDLRESAEKLFKHYKNVLNRQI
jgi:hypothetical protein